MFTEIVARFLTMPDAYVHVPARTQDQREHERRPIDALVAAKIHPENGQISDSPQVCYVFARDISEGGISVLHPVALCNGQKIDLRFGDGRIRMVEVRWSKQVEPECCMMGCKFI
jgi:hypothetical protein